MGNLRVIQGIFKRVFKGDFELSLDYTKRGTPKGTSEGTCCQAQVQVWFSLQLKFTSFIYFTKFNKLKP